MKIILDAMGGDNAPDAVVRGALEAAKEFGVQIVLVGRGADILASMKAQGWDTLPDGVELANAEDVVVGFGIHQLCTATSERKHSYYGRFRWTSS